ncbi:MAG TPA: DUF6518 family protein, partial [Candidatus Limnocylindria bacterium]
VVMGNAVGPWVAVAFAAGALQGEPRRGAMGGAIALCAGVATYYGAALLTWGDRAPAFIPQLAAVWLVVAAASGVVVGGAGGGWAANGRYRSIGPIALAGALLAEAAYQFVQVEGWRGVDMTRTGFQIAAIDTVLALLVPLALLERGRRRMAYLGSVAVGAAGFLVLAAVDSLIRAVLFALPA